MERIRISNVRIVESEDPFYLEDLFHIGGLRRFTISGLENLNLSVPGNHPLNRNKILLGAWLEGKVCFPWKGHHPYGNTMLTLGMSLLIGFL
jgi:hypothetical protein